MNNQPNTGVPVWDLVSQKEAERHTAEAKIQGFWQEDGVKAP